MSNRRLSVGTLAAAIGVLLASGCQNLARHLPLYRESILATGPATAIAAAPDGSWWVTAPRDAWRITSAGATASWALPWTQPGSIGAGVQRVAEIAISRTGRIALADPDSSLVWDAGNVASPKATELKPLAGTGTGFYPIGDGDLAISAQIDRPEGVAWGADGTLYISDTGHNRVRRVGKDDRIFTIAGSGFPNPLGDDGSAQQAGLSSPGLLAASKNDDLIVVDVGHDRTRTIANGTIQTLWPKAARGLAIDSEGTIFATFDHEVDGFVGKERTVVARGLHDPSGIAVAPDGRVAVADGDRVVLLSPE